MVIALIVLRVCAAQPRVVRSDGCDCACSSRDTFPFTDNLHSPKVQCELNHSSFPDTCASIRAFATLLPRAPHPHHHLRRILRTIANAQTVHTTFLIPHSEMAFVPSAFPTSFSPHHPSSLTLLTRHNLRTTPPQRRLRHTSPQCATSSDAPPTFPVLLDETVAVPSDLPCDRTGICLVAIKNENLGGRKRRVSGSIAINASTERVWQVLTAYSRLSRFLPNILECTVKTLDGALHVDQIGLISRKLMLRTRMLSRVQEGRVAKEAYLYSRGGARFSQL